jgi:hypothetical protein
MAPHFAHTLLLLAASLLPRAARADSSTDEARLGSFYTSIPLWRSGAGTNILRVGVGTPATNVNLTLSELLQSKRTLMIATNVPFLAVASDQCQRCTQAALE